MKPRKRAVVQDIDGTLETTQRIVGGIIQAIYPLEEPVALICNDEGELLNLPMNRVLRDENGAIYDVVRGTFFPCAAPPDSDQFESLSDQQVKIYVERFAVPEMFLTVDGTLLILPLL